MKKILPFFVLVSSFCFGMTDDVKNNLKICEGKENESRWQSSLEFLTNLIDDEQVSHVDKIHYLNRRKTINQLFHDAISFIQDIEKIRNLCETYPACNGEYISHYGYNDL